MKNTVKEYMYLYILKIVFISVMANMYFQQPLLHDPLEINLICWLDIITNIFFCFFSGFTDQ